MSLWLVLVLVGLAFGVGIGVGYYLGYRSWRHFVATAVFGGFAAWLKLLHDLAPQLGDALPALVWTVPPLFVFVVIILWLWLGTSGESPEVRLAAADDVTPQEVVRYLALRRRLWLPHRLRLQYLVTRSPAGPLGLLWGGFWGLVSRLFPAYDEQVLLSNLVGSLKPVPEGHRQLAHALETYIEEFRLRFALKLAEGDDP